MAEASGGSDPSVDRLGSKASLDYRSKTILTYFDARDNVEVDRRGDAPGKMADMASAFGALAGGPRELAPLFGPVSSVTVCRHRRPTSCCRAPETSH